MSASELHLGAGATAVRAVLRGPARAPAAAAPCEQAAAPLVFDAAGSWCFGWYHRASAPVRGVGVVLCRPVGYDAMCSYRAYSELAELLARSGFDVLRFDYQGTGDSAGSDADPGRVPAWIDSIVGAAAELRALAGVWRLALFGVRLGATLAAQAAARMGGVESLVMWAPCLTGKAFTRELRAASASRALQPAAGRPGDLEALGCLYTAQTLHDLQQLDCRRLERAPAARVLVIGRDDMPAEGPLPAALRAMGAQASYEVLPGYAKMMVEPHESVVDYASLGAVADWLAQAPAPQQESTAPALPARIRAAELPDGVREVPLTFGPGQSLFGILAEPGDAFAARAHRDTAVLLLNVGGNYRIGPNRFYVRMARSLAANGMRALRFDMGGIGDSRASGSGARHYFSKDSVADVRAAIDCLAAEGCTRFYVVGICSGSYVAFQAALADPRICGQVLMNSRLLEWRDGEGDDDGSWQALMQQHYKSTAFYWRALLRPQVWRRLSRGEVDVRGIARRMATLAAARVKRAAARLLAGGQRQESVLAGTVRLGARGTDTLVVMAAEDDGRDYVEFHFGAGGRRLRGDPNFRMIVVDDCDHTFSTMDSQRQVIGIVQEHLTRRLSLGG